MAVNDSVKTANENSKTVKKILVNPKKFKDDISYHKKRACFSRNNYKNYASFENWSIAINVLNNLPKNESDCAELLLDDQYVKPYLDIEWKKRQYPYLTERFFKEFVIQKIQEVFKTEFDIPLHERDILFASCHRDQGDEFKYSYHIIIYTEPQLVFVDKTSAIFLPNALRKLFNDFYLENKAKCTVCKNRPLENRERCECELLDENIIDNSVYNKGIRNFRMVGHSKNGEPDYPLVPENSGVNLLQYLITYISDSSRNNDNIFVLNVPEQEDDGYKNIKKLVRSSELSPKDLENIKKMVAEFHPSAHFISIDASGFLQFNYHDKREPCFTDENKLRRHDQIGFYAYLDNEREIRLGCHSVRCVDSYGKKLYKHIGKLEKVVKDFTFEKVDFDDEFEIACGKIDKYIYDGAIGISNLFKEMYLNPKRIKWIENGRNGTSYFWNGKLWENDEYDFLNRLITMTVMKALRKYIETSKDEQSKTENTENNIAMATKIIDRIKDGFMVQNILKFVKPLIRDPDFSKIKDVHPHFLSCKNGMVSLYTGEVRLATPDDNITKCLDIEYSPDANSDDFDDFVRQIISDEQGERPEIYDYLRWFIGYAMQGKPSKKMFVILYGDKGFNGKSMLMNTINDVLGYYAATMDKSVVLEGQKKSAGSHSTELVQLENCRIGQLCDTAQGSTLDDGQIKQLTGITDKLSVREIFGKQKEMIPTFVPFISTNHTINVNLTDKAMYERLIVIPFVLSFVDEPKQSFEKKSDNMLAEKLKSNHRGILKWLVDASIYYNNNQNKTVPQILKDEKENYNRKVNNYLDFIDKCLLKDPNGRISKTELVDLFKNYMKENILKIKSKEYLIEFDKLFESEKIKTKSYYLGYTHIPVEEELDDLDE